MAIQMGLDGVSVKLIDAHRNTDNVREILALTKDRYVAYTRAIDVGETDKATYWRIIFAILSVHSPIDATFEAYRALRVWRAKFQRIPSAKKLATLIALARGIDGVVQYQFQKASYIREFDAKWTANKDLFTRNGDSDSEWRLRIQANVKGLGLAKASFAVCLANPSTSDICCIDTHMFRLFAGKPATGSIGKKLYLALEDRIRELANEFGLSVFAAQWCLWDAMRGQANPHSVLATI
jgi:thermostable 8-oxoguanine DNA glycosylase